MTQSKTEVSPLTILLFGPPRVLFFGQPLPHLRSRKMLWLLALLVLRQGRPVGERIQSPNRHTLSLQLAGSEIDLVDFDTAIAKGTLAALDRAVALYVRPLLEGCNEEWVFQERTIHEQQCLQALQKLANAASNTGGYATATEYGRQAVRIAPLSDAAQQDVMILLFKQPENSAGANRAR